MNVALKNPVDTATRFKIEEDDLVVIDGRQTRCVGLWEEGVLLRPLSPRDAKPKAAKYSVISHMLLLGRLEVHRSHFGAQAAIERARESKGFELEPETVLRTRMVSEFIAQECSDDNFDERAHRSDEDIDRFTAMFKAENPELVEEARRSLEAKGKKHLFVGARQFRRLVARYQAASLHPTAMLDRRKGRSGSFGKFTHDELKFHLKFADEYRSPDQKTIKQCYIDMQIANRERVDSGDEPIRLPSLTTFQRLVKDGNDYLNESMRSTNKERVLRKFDFKRRGLQPTRPLQIVEMDEHEFDAKVLLTKNELWDYLAPKAQARIEGLGRVIMSVALDAFSRSVCGMKVAKVGNTAELAIATLAMVARPKDKFARQSGSTTSWPQCGTPDGVHTDAGAGYVSARFELAVMLYTGNHRIPPSKHPHLRGRVERFFRTINQRYIHLFPGRTFSNPMLADGFDSDAFARLTDEEVADLLVRLIVDCYHNTKHRSLGMTPLEAWERGSQMAKGPIAPPPNARLYREIFGSTIVAKLGNEGISIFGNNYSSTRVLALRKKWFDSSLMVRMNEEDLSVISVKHKFLNKWIDVPAAHDGLVGTSLEEWNETVKALRKNLGHNEEYSEKIVLDTLRAVKEVIALTERRPGAILHEDPAERLRKFSAEIGAFKWDQYARTDLGHRYIAIDTEEPSEISFGDDFLDEVFGDQEEPANPNGIHRRKEIDRHFDANADELNSADGSAYDVSRFVSPELRQFPPDQRDNAPAKAPKPKRAKRVSTARSPDIDVYRVTPADPTPGPERKADETPKPYAFKSRGGKE